MRSGVCRVQERIRLLRKFICDKKDERESLKKDSKRRIVKIKMKILFLGDSITDAGRNKDVNGHLYGYGYGFVRIIADRLLGKTPGKHEIINRGIDGNRSVDLYARIKNDVWNLCPDLISILVGVNDIWHEIDSKNGVALSRFEKVYRMMIEDTIEALPNVKIILCEPFLLKGKATENTVEQPDRYERFCEIYEYAKVVKKLAEEYSLPFLPLQKPLVSATENSKVEYYLHDGVHPQVSGARLIADEWLKLFTEVYKENE